MKTKLIIWAGLFVAGFLVGFVPESFRAGQLSRNLSATRQQYTSCEFDSSLSDAGNLLAMCYLEANNRNYGTAADYSSRYFDKMQKLADQTQDENLKGSIQEILGTRDKITAALAKGDPAVVDQLGSLLSKTYKAGQG